MSVAPNLPLINTVAREYSPAYGLQLTVAQTRQKRILDLVLGVTLLILLSPICLVCWIWIRVTSPGPALFRQVRLGQQGRKFVLLKFRSMINASDRCHREYIARWITQAEQAKTDAGDFKLHDDHRVTSAGRVLRKFSLDEVPQLWNVVRGEMSLVGPRPALDYELQHYSEWQLQRLNVLPGLTGLWQVSGRNRLTFQRMVELDLEYIRNWNMLLDIEILLRTIPVVLCGTGK